MDPLYYKQIGDIQPPQENRLRLLIDWGGLKGQGRKVLKEEKKGPKGAIGQQKDHKVGGTCSRRQLLQFWRKRRRQQRPKNNNQNDGCHREFPKAGQESGLWRS